MGRFERGIFMRNHADEAHHAIHLLERELAMARTERLLAHNRLRAALRLLKAYRGDEVDRFIEETQSYLKEVDG